MKAKSLFWGEHTWEELHALSKQRCVVVAPFGATEQHGPMLPVDTDIRIADKWAEQGAQYAREQLGVPVLVLPTVPFGLSRHHMRFAGTVTFEPEIYVSLVAQVLQCVIQHGFRRIAVLSGHGGNDAGIDLAIRKVVAQEAEGLCIARFQAHRDEQFRQLAADIYAAEPSQEQFAFHADRWETSETLADRPHLVRRDRMVRPPLASRDKPEWTFLTHQVSPTGASGDPSMARAELGELQWQAWATAIGRFVQRLHDAELPAEGAIW